MEGRGGKVVVEDTEELDTSGGSASLVFALYKIHCELDLWQCLIAYPAPFAQQWAFARSSSLCLGGTVSGSILHRLVVCFSPLIVVSLVLGFAVGTDSSGLNHLCL